jgi:hypothetical protein
MCTARESTRARKLPCRPQEIECNHGLRLRLWLAEGCLGKIKKLPLSGHSLPEFVLLLTYRRIGATMSRSYVS